MRKKSLSLILAAMMAAAALAGCNSNNGGNSSSTGDNSTPQNTSSTNSSSAASDSGSSTGGAVDTSEAVNLIYYLWGSAGVANADILAAINEKMSADINATIEVKYIDWGDTATKYPLLFVSGEKFDMSHASPTAAVSYFTLAAQGAIQDITGYLDAVPTLKAEIPDDVWATSKYQGQIYGVPTLYSEFTPYGYAYRTDWTDGDITDMASFEAYADKLVADGKYLVNGNSNEAQNLYRMMVALTPDWMVAPGIPESQPYLVATSAANYTDIVHPAFTDEFADWAKKMKEWADKGYWPRDILSSQTGGKDNFHNSLAGGFITHMPDWTGDYGSISQQLPDVQVDFWCFGEANGKIVRKAGVDNSTVISKTSEHPERALMAIEKFMTEEEYYRLIQYGIEGRQYEIVDGYAEQPADYDSEKDGGGFSAWSLRNDRFNIPRRSEDPRRYTLIEEWKKTSMADPFSGFSFDDSKVKTQLSNISNVNAQIGTQLMLGKAQGDVDAAIESYRQQLTAAGIEDVIAELKSQLESFTPLG